MHRTALYFRYRAICCSSIVLAVGGHIVKQVDTGKPGRTSHDPTPCRTSCSEKDLHVDEELSDHAIAHMFMMMGPVTLAFGIMTSICGCVWFPVIRDRYTKMINQ